MVSGMMKVTAVTPILNVSNITESFNWFKSLGWSIGLQWGEPVDFGSVCNGDTEIFLCHDGQGGRGKGANTDTFGEGENMDKGVWMSLWVDDVDAVHAHSVDIGIDITYPPTDMPWNVREMHIRHPDGHVFRVTQGL